MVVPRLLENLCNPSVFHMLRTVKTSYITIKKFADWSCIASQSGLCEVHDYSYNVDQFKCLKVMPWLRWFVAGLSKRRTGLDLEPVSVTYVVGKVASELVLLRVLRCCPVTTFLSVLQTHVLDTMCCSLYPGAF